jgi:hypothetical protein
MMSPEKLKEILSSHAKWLRGDVGDRAVLTGADLTGADLTGAVLTGAVLTGAVLTGAVLRGGQFVSRAAVQFTTHGECGRELSAIRTDAKENPITLWCGCFAGTPEELRKFIADGDEKHRASRTLAMDTVLALLDYTTTPKE